MMVGWHHRLSGHALGQAPGDRDREARQTAAHGVTKSWTQLSDSTITTTNGYATFYLPIHQLMHIWVLIWFYVKIL